MRQELAVDVERQLVEPVALVPQPVFEGLVAGGDAGQEIPPVEVAGLRPMILRNVADDVGVCESTVSRVTSRKYAETPQGVVELKHFFGAGIKGANGVEVAPEAAKEMIRRLVALEDPRCPLSDQQILARLRSDHGVVIARRTVAKYRDGLGIAGSSVRKQ